MSNKETVVHHMVEFIEAKERELQASKLTDGQSKTDVVKTILDELERETKDDN